MTHVAISGDGKIELPSITTAAGAQVARVPDLHLIDAVISTEDKQLLRKDGLNSCALR